MNTGCNFSLDSGGHIPHSAVNGLIEYLPTYLPKAAIPILNGMNCVSMGDEMFSRVAILPFGLQYRRCDKTQHFLGWIHEFHESAIATVE